MDDYRAEPGYEMTNWWHVDYGKGEPTKDAAGNPLEPNVLRELNRAIERLRDYRNLDDSTVVVNLRLRDPSGRRHALSVARQLPAEPYARALLRRRYAVPCTLDGGILDRKHRWGTWNTNTSSTVIHGGSGKHWLPVTPRRLVLPRAGANVRSSTTGLHPATSWPVLCNKAIGLLDHHALKASYRLAKVLNELFG